eukprot:SAG11_NODE_708_length_7648_cov_3.486687_8_plen_153_part_00
MVGGKYAMAGHRSGSGCLRRWALSCANPATTYHNTRARFRLAGRSSVERLDLVSQLELDPSTLTGRRVNAERLLALARAVRADEAQLCGLGALPEDVLALVGAHLTGRVMECGRTLVLRALQEEQLSARRLHSSAAARELDEMIRNLQVSCS